MHNCLRHMVPTASVPRRPGSARAERGALPTWPVPAATWQKCTEGAPSRKEKSQMWLRSSGETLQKEKTCVPSFVIRLCKHVRSCFILLGKKNSRKADAVHWSSHLLAKQTGMGLAKAWGSCWRLRTRPCWPQLEAVRTKAGGRVRREVCLHWWHRCR